LDMIFDAGQRGVAQAFYLFHVLPGFKGAMRFSESNDSLGEPVTNSGDQRQIGCCGLVDVHGKAWDKSGSQVHGSSRHLWGGWLL